MFRLLGSIYQAAHDSSLWTNVLQEIADAVHADTVILATPMDDHAALIGGLHAASWKAMLRERMDIERPECGRELVLGRYFSRPAGDDSVERISLYCDVPSAGQMVHAMGQKIAGYGEPYLLVVRRKECGTFGQDEQCIFATLAPHLANALSLHLRMASAQVQVESAHAVLNAFEHAVLRLDRTGHVRFISHTADTLLRTISEVQVKDGRLHMTTAALQGALADAIQAVTAPPHGRLCQSLTVQRHDETQLQITLLLSPLPSSSSAEIMVLLTDPRYGSGARTRTLRELYYLSPAEARVAGLLAQGLTVREISEQLRLNLETVRFHVKRLLAKTGSRRQAELMKLMLSLPCL
jgi:DNA-binding CsgD family transcriptional regulator